MKFLFLISLVIALIVGLSAGVTAGVAALLFALLAFLVSYVGFIPFVGPLIYWGLMAKAVTPFVASFATVGAWAGLIFWIYCILAIIYCAVTSFIVLMLIFGSR